MTTKEFSQTKFGQGMRVKLFEDGTVYEIASVDFDTEEFGIYLNSKTEEIYWVSCIDVDLIKE